MVTSERKEKEEKINYVSVLFCYTANSVCLGGQRGGLTNSPCVCRTSGMCTSTGSVLEVEMDAANVLFQVDVL